MLAIVSLCAVLGLPGSGPEEAARRYLSDRQARFQLSEDEIGALQVVRRYPSPGLGLTTLWLQQTLEGLPVEGATVRFAIDAEGLVVWARADALAPGLRLAARHEIDPAAAVAAAARHAAIRLGGEAVGMTALADGALRFSAPGLQSPARAVPVALAGGRPAWRIDLEARSPHDLWTVLVDALEGGVAFAERRVAAVQDGLVFNGQYPDTRPGGVPQSQQSFGVTAESPSGWLFAAPDPNAPTSQGNNCDVKEDWPPDNEMTVGARADGGVNQEFRFAFANSWETASDHASDFPAAATNVFYWVNRWHDLTYALGFDEAAGNCQVDNFGKGGAQADSILIDVQNGAGATPQVVNNLSNVTTPVDGTRPRMTLYLWDGSQGARSDAAFDADVILHELTHILVARLVGGPGTSCVNGTESGPLVEGIGDWFAADTFNSAVVGEYVSGNMTTGIRDVALDTNTRTYCDFSTILSTYQRGTILASILWELRNGIGAAPFRQLVVDALKLVPCDPKFPDLRDGLIQADAARSGGANRCAIYGAFKRHGVGYTAVPGGGASGCDLVFDLPACSGEAFLRAGTPTFSDAALGNNDGFVSLGETIELTLPLSNADGAAAASMVSAAIVAASAGITVLNGSRPYADIAAGGSGSNAAPFTFRVDPGYVCGQAIAFDATYTWQAPARTRTERIALTATSRAGTALLADDAEGASPVWTMSGPAALSPAENHTSGGARSYYLSAGCWTANEPTCPATTRGPCDNTCAALTAPPLTLPAEETVALSFWARYNLQNGTDAILVQVSTNGGASWTSLPVQGGAAVAASNAGCLPAAGTIGVTGPAGNAGLEPWTQFRVDLAPYAGASIQLRIAQHLSGCIYFEGAYIDDIGLLVSHCQTAPFAKLHAISQGFDDTAGACSDRDGFADPAETILVGTQIANIGSATAPGATASLESTNPNITGLPSTQNLGDLAAGALIPASFTFGVTPLPGAACNEDARLTLRYTSTLPSTNTASLPALLNTDAPISWLDNFEGLLPPWTAALGPQGTNQDWAIHELDCLTVTGNRFFWATQQNMVQTSCATGEPDYRPDSDSVLTSPPIDLGFAGATLQELNWSSFNFANTVEDGFSQVLIDHDNDGTFTSVATIDRGFAGPDATGIERINLQNNPDLNPLPAASTTQTVRIQFRFRSRIADPGNVGAANGWVLNNVRLVYLTCPQLDCSSCDPPPTFAGVSAVVDLDPCAQTGVEVRWDPAPFGPKGGTYTVWRDGVPLATGLLASPYTDVPGDTLNHRYRVTAVTNVCMVDEGNTTQITENDAATTATPLPLGNVVTVVKSSGDALVGWTDVPTIPSYDAAYSDTKDFATPTTFGLPTTGNPGVVDGGALALPGLRTYKVATVLCGNRSSY